MIKKEITINRLYDGFYSYCLRCSIKEDDKVVLPEDKDGFIRVGEMGHENGFTAFINEYCAFYVVADPDKVFYNILLQSNYRDTHLYVPISRGQVIMAKKAGKSNILKFVARSS